VRSNEVRGEVEVDTDDVTDRPRVSFDIPVESLDSGVPLMNDVMLGDRWLDRGKAPSIRFSMGRIGSPTGRTPLIDGKPVGLTAEGPVEMRGVTGPVAGRAEVTWMRRNDATARRLPGDLLHVVAQFDVPLAAFGIESHLAPTSLDKVAGTLAVEV